MDNTDKRIRETINSMPDKDLFSIGDAQVASDEAKKKALYLQNKAVNNEPNIKNSEYGLHHEGLNLSGIVKVALIIVGALVIKLFTKSSSH